MSQIPKALAIYMMAMIVLVGIGACLERIELSIHGLWWVVAGISAAGLFCIICLYDLELKYLQTLKQLPSETNKG